MIEFVIVDVFIILATATAIEVIIVVGDVVAHASSYSVINAWLRR